MRRIQSPFLLILALILCVSPIVNAQISSNSTSESSVSGLNQLGGFYFQDPSGVQIAIQGFSYEGSIDKTTYLLGPNDLIAVQIETSQNILLRGLLINISGEVVIPSIGPVNINALTILEAEKKLELAVSSEYKSPKVTISVEIPHPVNVHINGSIPSPGKYVLPAQSRVDLALLLATESNSKSKGTSTSNSNPSLVPKPQNSYTFKLGADSNNSETDESVQTIEEFLDNDIYSFRNIIIKHRDGTSTNADLISYFRAGNLAANPIIRDGDQILVKKVSTKTPTVSISGAVNSGYEIEYRVGDTPSSLLAIGGGFDKSADSTKVFIFRRQASEVQEIELSVDDWNNFEIKPNDRVVVAYDRTQKQTASAWILGETLLPGNFPIINGETSVSELLKLSGGLTSEALSEGAFLLRGTNLENEIPNKFDAELMLRTSDQLIEGFEYFEMETHLSKNRVNLDLSDIDQLQHLKIFNGDTLYIPKDEKTIFIFGQVNNPGYFPFTASSLISVNDYITKAGGFALAADEDRIFILKAGSGAWYKPSETKLESGDRIFVDKQPLDNLASKRTYEFQRAQLKNQRFQLLLAGISTITGIITTYVALSR